MAFSDIRDEEIDSALQFIDVDTNTFPTGWRVTVGTAYEESTLAEVFPTEKAALDAGEQWQLTLSIDNEGAAEASWFHASPVFSGTKP